MIGLKNRAYASYLITLTMALTITLTLLSGLSANAQTPDRLQVCGLWEVESKAYHIYIEADSSGLNLTGRILWMAEPRRADGSLHTDSLNLEANLRGRTVLHASVITSMTWNAAAQEWERGVYYDPSTGNAYQISFETAAHSGNLLLVEGFEAFNLAPFQATWRRVAP